MTVITTIFGLPTGQRHIAVRLTLPTSTLQVRELIAHKVRQEILEYAAHQRSGLSGEYLSPEELLGAEVRPGEIAQEIARAQQAFAARAYMVVIDNRRIVDPDATLTLQPDTQVEFIKILPLVGG